MSHTRRWDSGQLIGERYRIDHYLAEGGAGEVYAAQNVWTSRQVAVKRLLPELRTDATLVERFLLEGRIGGRIEHPNIVQVLDMGCEASDESLFIVQELLRGSSLRVVIEKRGRLSVIDALDLAVPILGALVAVHQEGIVHRDIKPENIFVLEASFGQRIPKLLDFGIAKVRLDNTLTQAGCVMGTLGYMPPEQLEGSKEVDRRADIWSMGIVMYELIAGAHPFQAESYLQAIDKIMRHDARPLHDVVPGCSEGLSDIVQKVLRKNRQERPDSVLGILEELLRWSRGESDERLRALVSRHRMSIPSSLEQKLLTPSGSMRPPPLWGTLSGIRAPAEPVQASDEGEPQEPVAAADDSLGEFEVDVDLESQVPPADDESEDTIIELRDALMPPRVPKDQARSAVAAIPIVAGLPFIGDDDEEPDSGRGQSKSGSFVTLAADALAANDFLTACRVADRVASGRTDDPVTQASMRLLQARACFWLGDASTHEAHAIDAFGLAAPGSSLRMQATGELACASSATGAHERLQEIAEELVRAEIDADVVPDYLIACCRVGIALQRAGWPEHVEHVLGHAQDGLHAESEKRPDVRAWTLLLRAELADHAGDHAHSLVLTRDAVRAFEEHGDARWACVCKGNAGFAMLMLGGYDEAIAELSAAIDEASASNIRHATVMRLNLGLAEVRSGALDRGVDRLKSCVESLASAANWRVHSAGRTYLAEGLWLQDNLEQAEREARAAVELAQPSPSLRAQGLAMLAMVLLNRPFESFMAVSQAMEILTSLGGVAEDEARIRLVYAMAFGALGHARNAREALTAAHRRLLARAARISDERWRTSFLERVGDHAKTIALASKADAAEKPLELGA